MFRWALFTLRLKSQYSCDCLRKKKEAGCGVHEVFKHLLLQRHWSLSPSCSLAASLRNNKDLHTSRVITGGFAVVASQSRRDWESPVVSSGDILPQERITCSGVIRLELFSGVQLVVEGEAKFVIDSPLSVTLNQVQVRAYVPDVAHGFRVVTEAGKIIDYGTEFSVRVDGDTTDVTVLDGEVGVVQRGTSRNSFCTWRFVTCETR